VNTVKADSFASFVLQNGRCPTYKEDPVLSRWVKYQREKGVTPELEVYLESISPGLSSFLNSVSSEKSSNTTTIVVCSLVDDSGNLPANHFLYNWLYRKRSGIYKVYISDIAEASRLGFPHLFEKESE
jgi:hypothetical protein